MPKETLKKVMNGDVPVGPDKYYGGDGLPDWMQFVITCAMFGLLFWILNLLFHPTLELDPTHRDLLNIILGTFIATFAKVIDFWFNNQENDNKLLEHADD